MAEALFELFVYLCELVVAALILFFIMKYFGAFKDGPQ